jgi:CheY-like chemotaxis protein
MGSNFRFTIIAQDKFAEAKPHQKTDQPALEGKRLLIVENTETNLRIIKQLATSWHMLPETAAREKEAIDLVRSHYFNAAILGAADHSVNLSALASKLRQYQKDLPIILCLSFGAKKNEDCNQFNGFITKPIKPYQLHEALRKTFGSDGVMQANPPIRHYDSVHKLRILLAEDNVINQKVAMRILKKIGYRADLAANGLEVLQALERLHYDVVLMDVQMPEMDGLEATRIIRKRFAPEYQPRIIAITAYALEGDREKCLDAGMDGYISKPVSMNELADALETCRNHPMTENSRSADIR